MPFDHEHEPQAPLWLDREHALLLVIDVQEKLASAMPADGLALMQKNAAVLIKAARRLGLPVVATEQYPKASATPCRRCASFSRAPLEKMEFSCGASKPIARKILASGRKQIIVAGMESHVCVFQTVRDLVRGEFSVFVAEDGALAHGRQPRSRPAACEKAGATLTSTETVLFDLLGAAGTPEFKELAR